MPCREDLGFRREVNRVLTRHRFEEPYISFPFSPGVVTFMSHLIRTCSRLPMNKRIRPNDRALSWIAFGEVPTDWRKRDASIQSTLHFWELVSTITSTGARIRS